MTVREKERKKEKINDKFANACVCVCLSVSGMGREVSFAVIRWSRTFAVQVQVFAFWARRE